MGDGSILIVHPDRKTQRTVQRILGVTGYRVEIADELEQGIRLMQHVAPELVVVDECRTIAAGRGVLPRRRAGPAVETTLIAGAPPTRCRR